MKQAAVDRVKFAFGAMLTLVGVCSATVLGSEVAHPLGYLAGSH